VHSGGEYPVLETSEHLTVGRVTKIGCGKLFKFQYDDDDDDNNNNNNNNNNNKYKYFSHNFTE
jgi:hypothetical protein